MSEHDVLRLLDTFVTGGAEIYQGSETIAGGLFIIINNLK